MSHHPYFAGNLAAGIAALSDQILIVLGSYSKRIPTEKLLRGSAFLEDFSKVYGLSDLNITTDSDQILKDKVESIFSSSDFTS